MAGLFSTLNTASLGLTAQQDALNVTSHNVANANTAGYTREVANMAAISSANVSMDNSSTIQIGTGVQVTDISRVRDVLQDYQVRAATTTNSTYTTTSGYLTQIQSVMNEPSGTGLSSLIGAFYSDWSSVATNSSSDSAARTTLVQDTKTLTDTLNGTSTQLQNLKTDAQTAIQAQVADVNTKLDEADTLNQNIMSLDSSGSEPNDLLDQRDLLVDQLSQSFNVSTTTGSLDGITLSTPSNLTNGSGSASTSNATFLQPITTTPSNENRIAYAAVSNITPATTTGGTDSSCTVTYQNATTGMPVTLTVKGTDAQISGLNESRVIVTNKADGLAANSNGGASIVSGSTINVSDLTTLTSTDGVFAGLTTSQQNIDKYSSNLDNVAQAMALTVNTVEGGVNNTAGTGTLSADYFVNSSTDDTTGITAGNITINSTLLNDPTQVVTGKYTDSASGDGTRALAISQLGNVKFDMQDMSATPLTNNSSTTDSNGIQTYSSDSNGTTVSGYYTNKITAMGTDASEASSQLTAQTSVLNSLTQTRTSESGVSTDEEMTNLIQYDHAYEANAKVISTVSTLLDAVIAMIQ